jgi:hypothetical protein
MESCTVGSKSHSKPQFRQQSASRVSEYRFRTTSWGNLASSTNMGRLEAPGLSLVAFAVPCGNVLSATQPEELFAECLSDLAPADSFAAATAATVSNGRGTLSHGGLGEMA